VTAPHVKQAENTSLAHDLVRACGYYLRGWRGVLLMAAIALATGLAFSWSWLVEAGIAPALLTVLPCLVMCGAGLCMNKLIGAGRSCESQPVGQPTTDLAEKEKQRWVDI
jgi:hypothetical protein